MKNIILIITLLYTSIACAQERIIDGDNRPADYFPQKGDYIVYNSLNDFEGAFIWENSSKDKISIILEKKKYCVEGDVEFCTQILIGSIEYKKNGQLIVSKEKIPQKESVKLSDIESNNSQIMSIKNSNQKIILSIKDDLLGKSIKGTFDKLDGGKYSLKLSEPKEYSVFNRNKKKGFTFPEEMILTKIN